MAITTVFAFMDAISALARRLLHFVRRGDVSMAVVQWFILRDDLLALLSEIPDDGKRRLVEKVELQLRPFSRSESLYHQQLSLLRDLEVEAKAMSSKRTLRREPGGLQA